MKYLVCLLLLACQKSPTHIRGIAMTIPYTITIEDRVDRVELRKLIESTFDEIDQSCNHWNPNSAISMGHGHPILDELNAKSQEIFSLTKGRFDPSIGPVIALWKEALSQGSWINTPTRAEGPSDFDGISKGYTVDLISKRLREKGYKKFLVQWGGEAYGVGKAWKMLIPHPESSKLKDGIDVITLENQAIATSGDYIQQWNIGGKIYTHLIDPRTLYPLEVKEGAISSVTVVADTCAHADALATSGLLFSPEEFASWSQQIEGVAFWAMTR